MFYLESLVACKVSMKPSLNW